MTAHTKEEETPMSDESEWMHAVQLAGPALLAPVDAPIPEALAPGEICVRLELAGICGSDRPGFIWGKDRAGQRPPGFPVHECIGTVVQTNGDPALLDRRVIAIPNGDTGLSELFCAPITKTHVLRHPLPVESAILAQPLATVLAAADRLGDVRGAKAAVLGLGPIGLMFGYVLREMGVETLAGFDRQDRSSAPLISCFDCIGTEIPPASAFALVIDAVGHDQEIVNLAIGAAAHRGTVLAFGVPDDDIYALHYMAFFRKCLALVANVQPDWQTYLPRAEDFIAAHLVFGTLVTHVFDVADAQTAFETAFLKEDPCRGKVLITPGSWQ
jgi:L-iditol 2-dehydrogenase